LLSRVAMQVFGQDGNDTTRVSVADGLSDELELIDYVGGDGLDALEVFGGPGSELYDVSPGAEDHVINVKMLSTLRTATLCVDADEVESVTVDAEEGDDVITVN